MADIQPIGPIVNPGSESGTLYFILSARDIPLRDRGLFGSTIQDPYIRWSSRDIRSHEYKVEGMTTVRKNDSNPDWFDQVFRFQYRKGQRQKWRFELLDKDFFTPDDKIDRVDLDVDNYVARGQRYTEAFWQTSHGNLFITGTRPISFKLSAQHLPRLDPFDGMSDPYVKCYWSEGADGPQVEFARTKTIKDVENCQWEEPVIFEAYQPGQNHYLTFQVFDEDTLPRDDKIGTGAIEVDKFVRERTATLLKLGDKKTDEGGDEVYPTLIVTPDIVH